MHAVLSCTEQDISFGVFHNEHGMAEFAMQVVKDAKGMTFTPSKRSVPRRSRISRCWGRLIVGRPEHSLHEGLEPRPLFWSPILTHLAMFVGRGAFRDYDSTDGLLDIEPPQEEMFRLE